jgi:hypothetical protein
MFTGIRFYPGVAAESLPFAADSFAAVSGQYALEYTDVARSLAEVMRVLKPDCDAQFIVHHADSLVVERARASLRHSDAVLNGTKLYRKLRKFLQMEQRAPGAAGRPWQELSIALDTLRDMGRSDPSRVIDVTLDAVPKLLSLRTQFAPAVLAREVDSVENALRDAARRHNDLIAAAASETTMAATAECARACGFVDVGYEPWHHAKRVLVGWRLRLRKPA